MPNKGLGGNDGFVATGAIVNEVLGELWVGTIGVGFGLGVGAADPLETLPVCLVRFLWRVSGEDVDTKEEV